MNRKSLFLLGGLIVAIAIIFSINTYVDEGVELVVGVSLADKSGISDAQLYAELSKNAGENINLLCMDAASNLAKQREDINYLAEQGVDALVITPTTTSRELLLSAIDIPVIVLDHEQGSTAVDCHIVIDSQQAGRLAGEWINSNVANPNLLEIQDDPSLLSTMNIKEGLRTNIVPSQIVVGNEEYDDAYYNIMSSDVLSTDPNILFAHNYELSHAALSATKGSDAAVIGIVVEDYLGNEELTQELQAVISFPTGAKQVLEVLNLLLKGQEYESLYRVQPTLIKGEI